MTDTLPELADELDAIALSVERGLNARGLRTRSRNIRDIADKLRAYPVRDGHPVAPYGYVPDEPQLPYIAGPDKEVARDALEAAAAARELAVIENSLEESVQLGFVERTESLDGTPTFRLTEKGKLYVEQMLLPSTTQGDDDA